MSAPTGRATTGRAATPEHKRAVIEAVLRAWLAMPHQRLGQFLVNACGTSPLFYAEDDDLARLVTELEERTRP